jgi:hypothetical protein
MSEARSRGVWACMRRRPLLKPNFLIVPLTAISLTFTSTAAAAAGSVGAPTAPVATCAITAAAGTAAAAQAVRPGCVLPAVDAAVPVSTEAATMAGPAMAAPGMGGWVLPLLGLVGLTALLVAINGGKSDGSGSLSRA